MDAANTLRPIIRVLSGGEPSVAIRFWDGSSLGPQDAPAAIIVRSPRVIRRLLFAATEVGLGRAYVAGELDIEGDIFQALDAREAASRGAPLRLGFTGLFAVLRSARSIGALGFPLAPPPEEAGLRGRLHSKARDAAAISHHYDVSNDFYRLFLGETMTYSCAYFPSPDTALDAAQRAKYDLVCRKLGLHPGMRLLDVGCGWGGMVLHAAEHYGVRAVGVTISRAQADLAAKRVADYGLADRVAIRLQDYRDVSGGPFDAISSIGMFEHVGLAQLERYFATLFRLLGPRGRLLNHAISRPSGDPGIDPHSFIARYVFPDAALHEVGSVVSAMQRTGFEVRDVESLREHYARTLRCWVANLQSHRSEAEAIVGSARTRIWLLYMAGSALGFEAGRINVHQVLAIKPDAEGVSGMPPTRRQIVEAIGRTRHQNNEADRPV